MVCVHLRLMPLVHWNNITGSAMYVKLRPALAACPETNKKANRGAEI